MQIKTQKKGEHGTWHYFFHHNHNMKIAYYIKEDEPIGFAIKRIALEQTEQALTPEEDIHETIHDVRKRCKKLRALLRLVSDDLGKNFYKEQNVFYRDNARKLSDLRDIHVNIRTIEDMKNKHQETLPCDSLDQILERLRDEEHKLVKKKIVEEAILNEVVDALEKSKKEIFDWPVSEKNNFDMIGPNIKRVYKRGYKAFSIAYEEQASRQFHEFRKRAKYLWYHTRLLKELWPGLFKKRAKEIHQLTGMLGNDHDLMVIKEVVNDLGGKDGHLINTLNKLIERESQSLRLDAKNLSQLIYAEKPKRYTQRIGAYWKGWQNMADTEVVSLKIA